MQLSVSYKISMLTVIKFAMYIYIYRGAAGRLMRLEDTQMLLDDFGIPLQISPSSDSKEKPAVTHVRQNSN